MGNLRPGGNGGCGAGQCVGSGGTATATLRGVDFQVDLGKDSLGQSYGTLRIFGDDPTAAMGTPAALRYDMLSGALPGLIVTRAANGDLGQVMTPGLIASAVVETSSSFHIDLSRRNASGQAISPPFETWGISFTSATLTIRKTIGGQTKLQHQYQPISGRLTLSTSDGTSPGPRSESEEWSTGGDLRTYRITDATNGEMYHVEEQYAADPAGQRGKLKVRETVFTQAQGGSSLETQTGYWPPTSSVVSAREQLRWIRRPDGSWTYYDYDNENSTDLHRYHVVVSAWKDGSPEWH